MNLGNYIRIIMRAPTALFWTLSIHWLLRLRSFIFRRKWGKRRALELISLWGKGLAWIMGVRIKYLNRRDWPMGDVVIANHMGFLDVPALLSVFPAVFAIKMEMRRVPYFGAALEKEGHVFVERSDQKSRAAARQGLQKVLEDGDRIIIFPEGRASPGAERLPFKPFSFFEAARQHKRVEACVIDYLPDRRQLQWDVGRPTLPQLAKLFGRRYTEISLEFFPSEVPKNPEVTVARYHDLIESKLKAYDSNGHNSSL